MAFKKKKQGLKQIKISFEAPFLTYCSSFYSRQTPSL